MNKTFLIALAGIVVVGAILYMVFANNDDMTLTIDDNATSTMQNSQNGTTSTSNPNNTNTTNNITPRNSVVLGEIEGGNVVTVPSATLIESGYVVLYRVNSNGDSTQVGNSDLLEAGIHSNISIQLDSIVADQQAIVATLHEDDGDGEFEYPESDAYLLDANGIVVNDIDVVGIESSAQESIILENQVEAFLDANFDATTISDEM